MNASATPRDSSSSWWATFAWRKWSAWPVGIAVNGHYRHYPVAACEVRIGFGCEPDKMADLITAGEAEVDCMRDTLSDDRDLAKTREIMLQERLSDVLARPAY